MKPKPPTAEQIAEQINRAKLAQVRHLIGIISKNDPEALAELLARLAIGYKHRFIAANDTATPEQMAQGVLVAVLMAAIAVDISVEPK